jgi:isochorismate hydrolase
MQLEKNFKILNEKGTRENINILFCDIQDKYIKKIANNSELLQKCKVIAEISKTLKFNQIITEQKREVFGGTVREIISNLNENTKIIEKSRFSMFSDDEIDKMPIDDVYILLGIEAHICVYQTALNFIKKDRNVIVLADAVSSSNLGERKIALENLRDMGCYVTTCQGLVFLMLQDSLDENFTLLLKNLRDLSSISGNLLLDREEVKGKF